MKTVLTSIDIKKPNIVLEIEPKVAIEVHKSLYDEAVKHGFTGSFDDFLQQLFADKANVLSQTDW